MAVYNTAAGSLGAIQLLPGGVGLPTNNYLLCSQGTFVCNGATPVVVANANLTANSQVLITLKTIGGTVGAVPAVTAVTAGTGFSTTGTASDTSTYNYLILG